MTGLSRDGKYITDPKTGRQKLASAVEIGSIKSEKKAAASRANGQKFKGSNRPGGARQKLHLAEITCNCAAGVTLNGHKWDCPRAVAIKRRVKQGVDLVTGKPLDQVGLVEQLANAMRWGTYQPVVPASQVEAPSTTEAEKKAS